MIKKIVVSLLSISLMVALMIAALSPSSVMAIVGLSSLDSKNLSKVQTDAVNTLKDGMRSISQNLSSSTEMAHTSDDEAVVIEASKTSADVTVIISFDACLMPDFNYSDIGKVMKVAKNYLEPVFNEKQAVALCGLLLGDAYTQYRKGNVQIDIIKEYEGLTITCAGNINSGMTMVSLKSTQGVKKCLSNKLKIMEMRVSPH